VTRRPFSQRGCDRECGRTHCATRFRADGTLVRLCGPCWANEYAPGHGLVARHYGVEVTAEGALPLEQILSDELHGMHAALGVFEDLTYRPGVYLAQPRPHKA